MKYLPNYREVKPVAHQKAFGFWDVNAGEKDHRGGVTEVEVPVWSVADIERGRARRERRRELGLTLGDAARSTGLTVSQISLIERGGADVDEAAYDRALQLTAEKMLSEKGERR